MRRAVLMTLILALPACGAPVAAPDAANATYQIERASVTLVAGRAEVPAAPGSAAKAVTTLGSRATGDLDGDGRQDVAAILVQQPGGTGMFTYVAVLQNLAGGVKATNAVLVGDRVNVQAIRVDGRTVVIEYLDRRPGEPFSATPSVATTKKLVLSDGQLIAA